MVLLGFGILVVSLSLFVFQYPARWRQVIGSWSWPGNKSGDTVSADGKERGRAANSPPQKIRSQPEASPRYDPRSAPFNGGKEREVSPSTTPKTWQPSDKEPSPVRSSPRDMARNIEPYTETLENRTRATRARQEAHPSTFSSQVPVASKPKNDSSLASSARVSTQRVSQGSSLLMPPPPRPTALRPLPKLSSTLSTPPSLASTLRAPPARSLGPTLASSPAATSSILPASSRPSRKVILSPGHSPLDWAQLVSHPPTPTYLRGHSIPTHLIKVAPSLLREHNGRQGRDAWSTWQGKVYNITPYRKFHPGGEGELMRGAGKVGLAEELFMEIHPWVNWDGMLGECLVGILVGEDEGDAEESNLESMD